MKKTKRKIKNKGIIALLSLIILIVISDVTIIIHRNIMKDKMEQIVSNYIETELNEDYLYKIESEEGISSIDEWKGKLKVRYIDDSKCFIEGKSVIKATCGKEKSEYNMNDCFVLEYEDGNWSVKWNKSYMNM